MPAAAPARPGCSEGSWQEPDGGAVEISIGAPSRLLYQRQAGELERNRSSRGRPEEPALPGTAQGHGVSRGRCYSEGPSTASYHFISKGDLP